MNNIKEKNIKDIKENYQKMKGQKKANQGITKETTLAEVLAKKGAEEVLAKYKVPCLTCPMAKFEMQELTLGQICQMYSIDLAGLLKEMNNLASQKK